MNPKERTAKQITIKDIAKEANVSYSTVSRALAGNPLIKESTRSQILEIAERLGYTTNYAARSMVMRQSQLIGVILPSVDNPFMSEFAYHIECDARARGYCMMLSNSSYSLETEEKTFEILLGRQVDGIVMYPVNRYSFANLKKYVHKVPTVFINEDLQNTPESYVAVDNYQGARMATQYLVEQGHRRIVYFGRNDVSSTFVLRNEGYEDACRDAEIEPFFWSNDYEATTIRTGYEMARTLFAHRRDFTALQCAADTLALGALQAADELGIRVPQDLSIIGFDNIRYASLPRINLTTVEQPKHAMASVAVNVLLEKINTSYENYTHRILAPKLIERGTCAPPAAP